MVGEHGGFREIATTVFAPLAHVGLGGGLDRGGGPGAYGRVLRHARQRGGTAAVRPSSELVLLRLAGVRARLDAAHALLRHTVSVVTDAPDMSAAPVQLLLNTLKIRAAEESFAAAHELVELAGLRHGYLTDSPLTLERTFRDLRSASLNYANDRLRLANGALSLRDPGVRLA
nr:acyl-CoA dehydrogenase family protein [Micromonospora provocatoris]